MNSFPQLVFTGLASDCGSSICRGRILVPALDTRLVKGEEPDTFSALLTGDPLASGTNKNTYLTASAASNT